MSLLSNLTRGIIRENPTFRLVLGMCPTLATTTTLENGLGMGLSPPPSCSAARTS